MWAEIAPETGGDCTGSGRSPKFSRSARGLLLALRARYSFRTPLSLILDPPLVLVVSAALERYQTASYTPVSAPFYTRRAIRELLAERKFEKLI